MTCARSGSGMTPAKQTGKTTVPIGIDIGPAEAGPRRIGSRSGELEPRVEGVAAGVVVAQRTGAEDPHDETLGRMRRPEDEPLRHVDADVLLRAAARVHDRR